MQASDRELLRIREGKWRVTLPNDTDIIITRPNADEQLHIDRAYAKADASAQREGIPPFSRFQSEIEKTETLFDLPHPIAEERLAVFRTLLQSDEYNELLASSTELTANEYTDRFAELTARYVDAGALSRLTNAEEIIRSYYHKSAEYFAEQARLRTATYLCVRTETGNTYFESIDAVGAAPEQILSPMLRHITTLVLTPRPEAFFFISRAPRNEYASSAH